MNRNKIITDKELIFNEIKLNFYHLYISSLFIKYEDREVLLTILSLDMELNKVVSLCTDKQLTFTKFSWWKISCSEAIDGKSFAVPILRVIKTLFSKNESFKYKVIQLINLLQDYVNHDNIKAKQKFYYNYLVLKNDIIMSALKINITEKYIKKALRLSIIAQSYKKFDKNKEHKYCSQKAKSIYRRPKNKYLILFLLNSGDVFNKKNFLSQIILVKLRFW